MLLSKPVGNRLRGKRVFLVLALAFLVVSLWTAVGPASRADAFYAGPYCNHYNAAPWGKAGDSCQAPEGAGYEAVPFVGAGVQHSMCINAVNQLGGWMGAWQCSSGPFAEVFAWFGNVFESARGQARNNTTGDRNTLIACQRHC